MNGSEALFPTPVSTEGTPSIRRRLAAFTYEGVVLFGVLMLSGWLFSTLAQQRHALALRDGLQWYLFVVLGIYFITFWTRGGQTVAMRAWHLRVVSRDGAALGQGRALARYIASYLWVLPGLAIAHFSGLKGGGLLLPLALNVAGYALIARFTPGRQFLHDTLCGTRLITQLPAPKTKPKTNLTTP
jgi:uncharacterized RDD family membrane protein YckC